MTVADRGRITQMLSRFTFPLSLTEWKFHVHLKRFRSATDMGETVVELSSHEARISLSREAMADEATLRRYLLHELAHVITWPLCQVNEDLLLYVPDAQRKAVRAQADTAFEQATDNIALILGRVLA